MQFVGLSFIWPQVSVLSIMLEGFQKCSVLIFRQKVEPNKYKYSSDLIRTLFYLVDIAKIAKMIMKKINLICFFLKPLRVSS